MVPIVYRWDGEAMRPVGRFAKLCDEQFVVGEHYRLEPVQDRSLQSHRHYFACINAAWNNLPETYAGRWPTPDRLRKAALIRAGYYNEVQYTAESQDEALRFAKFAARMNDECEVEVKGAVVFVRTAKSQSYQAMTRREFEDSKKAVFAVLAELIGVTPDALEANARSAA